VIHIPTGKTLFQRKTGALAGGFQKALVTLFPLFLFLSSFLVQKTEVKTAVKTELVFGPILTQMKGEFSRTRLEMLFIHFPGLAATLPSSPSRYAMIDPSTVFVLSRAPTWHEKSSALLQCKHTPLITRHNM